MFGGGEIRRGELSSSGKGIWLVGLDIAACPEMSNPDRGVHGLLPRDYGILEHGEPSVGLSL